MNCLNDRFTTMPVLYKCRCASPILTVRRRKKATSCWPKIDCLAAAAVWYKYPSILDGENEQLSTERLVTKIAGHLVHSEQCTTASLCRAPHLKLHPEIKVRIVHLSVLKSVDVSLFSSFIK